MLVIRARKSLLRRRPVIITLISLCIVLSGLIGYMTLAHPNTGTTSPSTAKQTSPADSPQTAAAKQPGYPVRIKIPSLGVDAALDYVGLTSEGDMASPAGPDNGGWFHPGPRPGQPGNAVIAGHFGWKNNLPAVFDNLHTMQPGESIIVQDDHGKTTTFVVRQLRTFARDEDATSVFRATDDKPHLNLITCHGTWNKAASSFASRLVVFADIQ